MGRYHDTFSTIVKDLVSANRLMIGTHENPLRVFFSFLSSNKIYGEAFAVL